METLREDRQFLKEYLVSFFSLMTRISKICSFCNLWGTKNGLYITNKIWTIGINYRNRILKRHSLTNCELGGLIGVKYVCISHPLLFFITFYFLIIMTQVVVRKCMPWSGVTVDSEVPLENVIHPRCCKVVITWSRLAGIKFQPVQPRQISPHDYMRKLNSVLGRRDSFPPVIWLY